MKGRRGIKGRRNFEQCLGCMIFCNHLSYTGMGKHENGSGVSGFHYLGRPYCYEQHFRMTREGSAWIGVI
jgi:hypothetical protein